jgi:hypothetical protein
MQAATLLMAAAQAIAQGQNKESGLRHDKKVAETG